MSRVPKRSAASPAAFFSSLAMASAARWPRLFRPDRAFEAAERLGLPYQLAIIQRAWPLRCAPFGLRLRRRAHSFCSKPRFAPFPFRFSVELLLVATD
ncbi:MAG: hypothetical protein DMG96_37785 [Acidobacteria bacterium]|nr:MAG: hypothetical protein DMG96_37785 [Acidobacteriota bacterium]